MKLIFKIHNDLAVGYKYDEPEKWAGTLCKRGFEFGINHKFNNGDEVLADYSIIELVDYKKYSRSRQFVSYYIQQDIVMCWLSFDSGEWFFPIARYIFDDMIKDFIKEPFDKGTRITCRTLLVPINNS